MRNSNARAPELHIVMHNPLQKRHRDVGVCSPLTAAAAPDPLDESTYLFVWKTWCDIFG